MISAETRVSPGVVHVVKDRKVLLASCPPDGAYVNIVKKRLARAGRNPDNFVLSDLPWGERIEDTPLIAHKGDTYLQTLLLEEGDSQYYIGNPRLGFQPVNPEDIGIKRNNQGLPEGKEVQVNTYALSSILTIRFSGLSFTRDNS